MTAPADDTVAVPVPAGVDPTYCMVQLSVIDPSTTAAEDTYNMWVPPAELVVLVRDSDSITLINKTQTDINCLIILR